MLLSSLYQLKNSALVFIFKIVVCSTFHNPEEIGCTSCHAVKASAKTKEKAHQNLEAYPGRMQTVEQSCVQSGCHAELISLMSTLDGMLSSTRRVFGENRKNLA